MLNERDHYDYVIGQMSGQGTGLWGGLGNQQYQNQRGWQRQPSSPKPSQPVPWPSLSVGATGSAVSTRTSKPPKPSPLDIFATKWTKQVSKKVAAAFSWNPKWLGPAICATTALVFFGLALLWGAGVVLALASAVVGWFSPRMTLVGLRGTLYLLLATLYGSWQLCRACIVLAFIGGVIYVTIRLIATLA